MECSEPGIIRDEELLAYLAGERVRPVVEQHLARCPRCTAQVASFRGLERSLVKKLYRWDCPPSHILGEYQLGLLSNEIASAVGMHLNRCMLCAAELTTLSAFLADDPMLSAPVAAAVQPSSQNNHSGTKQDALRIFDSLRERSAGQARRIIAALVPQSPRLAYQRNTASASVWPRRYMAEDFSISVQIERGTGRGDALQLIGFVTRKGAALEALLGVPVQLSSQASAVYTQNIDELGNFVFSSVTPATYTLELQLPESTIVIEQLDLQD